MNKWIISVIQHCIFFVIYIHFHKYFLTKLAIYISRIKKKHQILFSKTYIQANKHSKHESLNPSAFYVSVNVNTFLCRTEKHSFAAKLELYAGFSHHFSFHLLCLFIERCNAVPKKRLSSNRMTVEKVYLSHYPCEHDKFAISIWRQAIFDVIRFWSLMSFIDALLLR